MSNTKRLLLNDRASGMKIELIIRDGVVVGACGSSPRRFLGMTEAAARHRARYANR